MLPRALLKKIQRKAGKSCLRISAVLNGEFFDYLEKRAELAARGHRFVTHCENFRIYPRGAASPRRNLRQRR